MKTKVEIGCLARTTYLKRTFSKPDTTNWIYKLQGIRKLVNDTIPSYETDDSRDR